MRWGILFRREVSLTYRRIQDIHLRSGILQRWLGLADILVQTASGSAGAEMTIEGLQEYEQVREFLDLQFDDRVSAWELNSDGKYQQVNPNARKGQDGCQEKLIKLADKRLHEVQRLRKRKSRQAGERNLKKR